MTRLAGVVFEPGNLEIATRNVTGRPGAVDRFLGTATELEYGVTGWWTSEWYFDTQVTRGQSALFTGYRWENRFRLLPREHWINPVVYYEFENINGADKSLLEVVGHDGLFAPEYNQRIYLRSPPCGEIAGKKSYAGCVASTVLQTERKHFCFC